MSWEFGDGFDFWATAPDGIAPNNWYTSALATTLSSPTRFNVGRSLGLSAGWSISQVMTGNRTVMFFNFAYYFELGIVLPGAGTLQHILTFYDSGSAQCSISFWSDGSIRLMSGGSGTGSTLATYNGAFSSEQWNHWQFKITINGSTGSIHIRKDGKTSDNFSATGLNTQNGGTGNAYMNQFKLEGNNALGVSTFHVDDFYCFTGDDGTDPHDFQGDIRALQIMPNGNSTPLQFTPSTGANWQCVDKLIPATTPNVSDGTVGHKDYYTVTPMPYLPTSIICVVAKMFSAKSDTNPFTDQVNVISNVTEVSSPTLPLASSNGWCLKPMTVDPDTSVAWTRDGVNAAILGPEVVSSP
jgi:hypothetical protein